jgi:hypothetical protein
VVIVTLCISLGKKNASCKSLYWPWTLNREQ